MTSFPPRLWPLPSSSPLNGTWRKMKRATKSYLCYFISENPKRDWIMYQTDLNDHKGMESLAWWDSLFPSTSSPFLPGEQQLVSSSSHLPILWEKIYNSLTFMKWNSRKKRRQRYITKGREKEEWQWDPVRLTKKLRETFFKFKAKTFFFTRFFPSSPSFSFF